MSKTSAPQLHEDVGALGTLLSLPHAPSHARWEERSQHAGATGTLFALLQFDAASLDDILSQSPPFDRRGDEFLGPNEYAWMPKAALVGIDVVEEKGRYRLVGVEPRKADVFLRAKGSPYVNGRITPLADGYVFVSAYAM